MPGEYIDDGLIIESAGYWARQKHSLIGQYASMFATSMKNKWDCRIYIDLFASCGFIKVRRTSKIEASSALIALGLENKFDKYIFCDIDKEKITALNQRADRFYPDAEAKYLVGDSNFLTSDILSIIPKPSKNNKVLCFCVIDPYKVGNFLFNTIQNLSQIFMDFLILIPSYMDAHRNIDNYFDSNDDRISNFLGDLSWRDSWLESSKNNIRFGDFFVKHFNEKMIQLGFLGLEDEEFVLIRNPSNNSPLYHLSFYSRSQLGKKFWKASVKGSSKQQRLF